MPTENKLDPYGQMRSFAEHIYKRAQAVAEEGQGRASRELRRMACQVEERFGAGEDLPQQPTLQIPLLVQSLELWCNGWRMLGASWHAIEASVDEVRSAMVRRRHGR